MTTRTEYDTLEDAQRASQGIGMVRNNFEAAVAVINYWRQHFNFTVSDDIALPRARRRMTK